MGFLSKVRKRIKKQIRPNNMMIGNIRNMPKRPNILGRGSLGDSFLFGRRPRGNLGSDFRMPQIGGILREGKKRRGDFGFGLGEAIRRLNEQQGMRPQPISDRMPDQETLDKFRQMASRPNPFVRDMITDDGRMYAGGSPGLYKPGGRFYNPGARLQRPNFSMEQIRVARRDPSALESLPMGDMPMTQDLPEVAPVGMMAGRTLQQDFPAERRMMMSEGDVAESGSNMSNMDRQMAVSNFLEQYGSTVPREVVEKLSQESGFSRRSIIEIIQEGGRTISDMDRGRTISDMDRQMGFKAAGSIGLDDQGNPVFPGYAEGGEADSNDFPDLSGDGQITRKDILIGQGVKFKAEGGEMMMEGNEIDAMLGGMDSEEAGAMEDLEQMAPEMEMIDQLVTMVVQMIQQGASEEEVIMFLREQGLDDEDIGTVLQLVAEMAEAEAMPQDGIGAELEQLA
jgi:hypothetical protein